jgi:hypothetical protein
MEAMGTLQLQRVKAFWQDRARDYVVMVDGREVGRIADGAALSIPLPAGEQLVQLVIDWCRSPEQRVTVPAGGTVRLECGPNATPLLALLYVSLWRNRYLWMRPAA